MKISRSLWDTDCRIF